MYEFSFLQVYKPIEIVCLLDFFNVSSIQLTETFHAYVSVHMWVHMCGDQRTTQSFGPPRIVSSLYVKTESFTALGSAPG